MDSFEDNTLSALWGKEYGGRRAKQKANVLFRILQLSMRANDQPNKGQHQTSKRNRRGTRKKVVTGEIEKSE